MQGLDPPCPCCCGAMKKRLRSSSPLDQESPPPRNKKILIESPSSSSSMKDPTIINTVSPPPAKIHHSDQLQSNLFVRLIPDSSSFTTPASPSLQVSPSLPYICTSNSVPFTSSENSISNVNSLASNSPVSCFNSKSSLPFKRPLPFKRRCNSVPLTTSSENSSEININNVNSFLSLTEVDEHHNPPHPQPPPPDPHPHRQPPPFHPLPPLPYDAPTPPAVWKICCIGATRIGTVTMMMIANFCPNVDITIVDDDLDVIHGAMQGEFPFHEPHLEMLSNHLIGLNPQRLRFTPDKEASIRNAHMIFIAIEIKSKAKPRAKKGQVEQTEWMNVWKYLVRMQNIHAKIIVDLTTLPLDFETLFRRAIGENLHTYRVVLNPSFITEGRAINDIHDPSIIVLATRDLAAAHALLNLYNRWVPLESIYVIPNLQSAVLGKLGLNSILASRVVLINTLNYMAKRWGAETIQFSHIITEAYRIEDEYLHPGVSFGDPGLEKSLDFLSEAASQQGLVDESRLFKQLVKSFVKEMRRL